jgi:transcriptional regulator with PAS, ATPase and Fis domain
MLSPLGESMMYYAVSVISGEDAGPYSLLVVTPEGVIERALPRQGRITIGRGEDNDIRIDDPSVSRRHAALEITDTLRIEDLGGANGTYVQRVRRVASAGQTENLRALRRDITTIEPGDRIVLGAAQLVVRRALPKRSPADTADVPHIVRDPRMIELYAQIERAAGSRVSVLLHGETGVGKDLLAQRLHVASPRKNGPFIAINSAALPETLLEAELFGAERGAYTGASHARAGLFEAADRGTLFLDEVGELSTGTQAKLLRVLEERKVVRVGGRTSRDIDVRFVAATNRNLKKAADEGTFRADLFFRLAGIVLHIPPLRDRPSEIEPLALFFLEQTCREMERPTPELSRDAIDALTHYSWPGNARELRNAMSHAAVLCSAPAVGREHLPAAMATPSSKMPASFGPRASAVPLASPYSTVPPAPTPRVLKEDLRLLERDRIIKALEECNGNQTRAAEALGISRRTLINRLDEYDVGRPRKR